MSKWPTIENIVILLVAGVLFALTKSPWSFIVLINLNYSATKKDVK